ARSAMTRGAPNGTHRDRHARGAHRCVRSRAARPRARWWSPCGQYGRPRRCAASIWISTAHCWAPADRWCARPTAGSRFRGSVGREVSHLFRGWVDVAEAQGVLVANGFDWLRFVDNGVVRAAAEQMPGLPVIHAYHLIPAAASKPRAVARHMQARAYEPQDCIAVGDSREDADVSA